MPRRYDFADLLLTGGALALTTAALLTGATRMEVEAARESARLTELETRRVGAVEQLAELDRRAQEDAAMRQAVARGVGDLQARFPARFSTALEMASRSRPQGVWLTRLCWSGTEVKAEGRTWGPAPATEFAGRLARSPHFAQVFTAPVASDPAGPDGFLLFARAVAR